MDLKSKPKVLVVTDETLPREKRRLISQNLDHLRGFCRIDLLKATSTEDDVLARIAAEKPALILVPWDKYLNWSRLDAAVSASKGALASAGTFGDRVATSELLNRFKFLRTIFIDLSESTSETVALWIQLLTHQERRLAPHPETQAPKIYLQQWLGNESLEARCDVVMGLPEYHQYAWDGRANAIRICLIALWSLIYEYTPGAQGLAQETTAGTTKATFEIAAGSSALTMRLCFVRRSWKIGQACEHFRPGPVNSDAPTALLLQFADFVRVHPIDDGSEVELTIGFTRSEQARLNPHVLHNLWIEPTPRRWYRAPMPDSFQSGDLFQPLSPAASSTQNGHAAMDKLTEITTRQNKLILQAREKLQTLRNELNERNELIETLRAGGVGVSQNFTPPDIVTLAETLKGRLEAAQGRIKELNAQIQQLESSGGLINAFNRGRAQLISDEIAQITNEETQAVLCLADVLETLKTSTQKKKAAL